MPGRPQLPGVRARALLSWTLGTGVVLLGIALVAIGALDGEGFTLERLAVAVLVLSAAGLLVGLASMLGLSRSLADRIDGLREAMAVVEQGRFDHRVAVDDGSEVGLLQAGFNRMLAGLQERERMRDLFGRQVGEDVVRLALERGVELGGEARDAAVLFIDLRGSTTLAEQHDPADVVGLLNRFFAVVVEVVSSHEGWVNKFARAASACPAGRVVAGNVGAAKRFEYTVIGDPVNQAARLTELAKDRPEGVLASEEALARPGYAEAARWEVCRPDQPPRPVTADARRDAAALACAPPRCELRIDCFGCSSAKSGRSCRSDARMPGVIYWLPCALEARLHQASDRGVVGQESP